MIVHAVEAVSHVKEQLRVTGQRLGGEKIGHIFFAADVLKNFKRLRVPPYPLVDDSHMKVVQRVSLHQASCHRQIPDAPVVFFHLEADPCQEKVTLRNEMMIVVFFLETLQGLLHAAYCLLPPVKGRINHGKEKMQRSIVPAFRSFPFQYCHVTPCLGHSNLFGHVPKVTDHDICSHHLKPGPDGAWKYLFMYAPLKPHIPCDGSTAQLLAGGGRHIRLMVFQYKIEGFPAVEV